MQEINESVAHLEENLDGLLRSPGGISALNSFLCPRMRLGANSYMQQGKTGQLEAFCRAQTCSALPFPLHFPFIANPSGQRTVTPHGCHEEAKQL